jgi:glycosyltransferase A (GT-A) superfamily protein (DUF2064 family)
MAVFGERLFCAAEDLFKCGFDSVCLIDSDSPTVPVSSFGQAMDLLSLPGDRVVLGPTDDGGYYLIGLKEPRHELFETYRLEYRTSVRADSRARARNRSRNNIVAKWLRR